MSAFNVTTIAKEHRVFVVSAMAHVTCVIPEISDIKVRVVFNLKLPRLDR